MDIVHAVWEERNLQVKTAEVEISSGDSLEDFEAAAQSLDDYEYICIKCAVNKPEFLFGLQQHGYIFLETQLGLKYECRNKAIFPTSATLRDLYADRISFRNIEGVAFEELLDTIENKEMFKTDRIYLDKYFPENAAGRRYAGWCRDLQRKGSLFLEYLIDGKPVGFYEYQKKSSRSWHTSLGGMYADSNEFALLTPAINATLLDRFEHEGMRTIKSAVSTNNAVILRLHLSVGYQVSNASYVYVKHN